MTPEFIAILGVGIALAGILYTAHRATRSDIAKVADHISELRRENGDLRERMAKLEGLLEGLREAIAGRRDAA